MDMAISASSRMRECGTCSTEWAMCGKKLLSQMRRGDRRRGESGAAGAAPERRSEEMSQKLRDDLCQRQRPFLLHGLQRHRVHTEQRQHRWGNLSCCNRLALRRRRPPGERYYQRYMRLVLAKPAVLGKRRAAGGLEVYPRVGDNDDVRHHRIRQRIREEQPQRAVG